MLRAMTSLPVPDSPWMNTGAWLRASLAICTRNWVSAGESPISAREAGASATAPATGLRACAISVRRVFSSSGLVTKSKAPSFIARIAASMLPKAVITATGSPGRWVWMCSTSSSPSPSGRRMSVRHSR